MIRTTELKVEKVGTGDNLADVGTKPLAADPCWKHMARMGQVSVAGRNINAKRLVT